MLGICKDMTAEEFLNETNKEKFNLLHHIAAENNYDAMEKLTQLDYFKDVVNVEGDGEKESDSSQKWTPLLVSIQVNP